MRLFFIILGFTTISGCNLTTGASVSVEVIIVEINGSTIRLEHESVPELPASIEEFIIDPNLARRVSIGDRVSANIIVGERPQVIGFAPPSIIPE
jgi:hypothetical protein